MKELGELRAEARLARVIEAVRAVYYAAIWSADRPCDETRLWTELRDACGFTPGESTRLLAAAQPEEKE